MQIVQGGVCAAKEFQAAGVYCGIRKKADKKDLALIVSQREANAAAVYTQNLVKGAPILVTAHHLAAGKARAMICNSGNANTCNANGIEIAEETCELVADALGISVSEVIVASTGVIGQSLQIEPFRKGIPALVQNLGPQSQAAAEAIMTTDTVMKEYAVSFEIDGVTCTIGGIAKGSGMINPNMATMLVFLTSDVAISPELLQKALSEDVKSSFNMISVDGDTSTNDMVAIMANGAAGNPCITSEGLSLQKFKDALNAVTVYLCRAIAGDGEGATKLIECIVSGASSPETARVVAKSVISSSLLKAAMFGADANWGRVLCAIGYSGAAVDVQAVDVSFKSVGGLLPVCKSGSGIDFSEERAKLVLSAKEIQILINLNSGASAATAWGCDLTYDYVKINGDYRS